MRIGVRGWEKEGGEEEGGEEERMRWEEEGGEVLQGGIFGASGAPKVVVS